MRGASFIKNLKNKIWILGISDSKQYNQAKYCIINYYEPALIPPQSPLLTPDVTTLQPHHNPQSCTQVIEQLRLSHIYIFFFPAFKRNIKSCCAAASPQHMVLTTQSGLCSGQPWLPLTHWTVDSVSRIRKLTSSVEILSRLYKEISLVSAVKII